jgi:cytochrome oxidase assembly protein ShyY1
MPAEALPTHRGGGRGITNPSPRRKPGPTRSRSAHACYEGHFAPNAPPALDEGPHESYAVQWFSFAAVALVGAGAFVRSERRRERGSMAV